MSFEDTPRPPQNPNNARELVALALPVLTVLVYIAIVTIGAFSGGMWGGAGIGLGIALYLGTAYLDWHWPTPSRDLLVLALVALLVTALLNIGSSNAPISWYDWTRLTTIFLPLALLTAPEAQTRANHPMLFKTLVLAAFGGAFALGVELFLDAPVLRMAKGDQAALTQYNRGLSYLTVLALPVLAYLWTKPAPPGLNKWQRTHNRLVPFALFIAVMLIPASLTESRAAKLALVLALLTAGAASINLKATRWSLTGITALLLTWPFIVQKGFVQFADRLPQLPESWRARVEIWDYMSYRILEHPIFGWGLGTSHTLDFRDPHGNLYKIVTQPAPHPHNVVTQLWVELGLPGLALGIAFALLMLRQASRLAPPLIPFALGAWTAALCLSLVAYNFWTDSMFSCFALTGFAFALLDTRLKNLAAPPL